MNDLFRKTQEEQETIKRLRLSQTPNYILELSRRLETLEHKLDLILKEIKMEGQV